MDKGNRTEWLASEMQDERDNVGQNSKNAVHVHVTGCELNDTQQLGDQREEKNN